MARDLTENELAALCNEYPVLANLRDAWLLAGQAAADNIADYDVLVVDALHASVIAYYAHGDYYSTARVLAGLD